MQHHVEIDGVRTWYAERGEGEPVVLLHGAIVDPRCFAGNLDALADSFRLHLPERHTVLIEKPHLCTGLVATFRGGPPAPTHMPIRRA